MQDNRKHNPALTQRARELRKRMTKQERHLWYDYLCHYPVRVMRQKVIGLFIADFYCASAKIIIELDGRQHLTEERKQRDYERDRFMLKFGIETIRYSNLEVDSQFETVCADIDLQIKNRMR